MKPSPLVTVYRTDDTPANREANDPPNGIKARGGLRDVVKIKVIKRLEPDSKQEP